MQSSRGQSPVFRACYAVADANGAAVARHAATTSAAILSTAAPNAAGGEPILLDEVEGELHREIDESREAGNNAFRTRRGGRAAECAGLENRCSESATGDQHNTCDEGSEVLAPTLRTDADLRAVIEAWPGLDGAIQAAIVQLCGLRSRRHRARADR